MNTELKTRQRKWIRIILFVLAGCLLIYTALGFLFFPFVGKDMVANKLSEVLHRKVSIEEFRVNPFWLAADIRGIRIEKAEESPDPFVSVGRLLVDLSPRKLFTPALFVSRLEILQPRIFITRNSDETFNFSDLISKEPKKEKTDFIFPLVIPDIRIDNGQVVFTDHAEKAVHKLGSIHFDLKDLSTLPIKDEQGNKKTSVRLSGRAELKNLSVQHKILGNLIKVAEVSLVLEESDLLNHSVAVRDFTIHSPTVQVLRDKENQFPLVSLFASSRVDAGTSKTESKNQGQESPAMAEPEKMVFSLHLNRFAIENGKVHFQDESRGFSIEIFPAQFDITNCVFAMDKAGQSLSGAFSLDVKSEQDEKLMTTGTFSWAGQGSPAVEAGIKASGLRAERYAPYYDAYVPYLIEKAGINMETGIALGTSSSKGLSVSGEVLEINELMMRQKSEEGDTLVEIPQIHMGKTELLIGEKQILLGPIESRKGKIFFTRNTDGTTSFTPPIPEKEPEKTRVVSPSDSSEETYGPQKDTETEEKSSEWEYSLTSVSLEDYEISFVDKEPSEMVSILLKDLNLKTGRINFTGEEKTEAQLDVICNDHGKIAVTGLFGLAPLSVDLNLSLKDVDLPAFSPYIEDQVRIRLTQGKAMAKTRMKIDKNSSGIDFACQGDLSVEDFTTIDKILSKKMITWKNLAVSGIDMAAAPFSLDIKNIVLDDLFAQLAVSGQGQSNISQLIIKKENGKKEASDRVSTPSSPSVSIGTIELTRGKLAFSDHLVSPHFHSELTQIQGTIKGVSSRKDALAKFDLKGLHQQSSPLEISGQFNPFFENLFVDVSASLRDVELVQFTPYFSKYLGRKIDKGKLEMDVKQEIKGSKLNAQNLLSLDQFTLGEKVKSKDAVSLPLDLAISLLRDQNGRIRLDVPVSGDLSDPSFRLGSVFLRVIQNVIVKTVSAPFSILGAMVGKGEELGYVAFVPGQSTLSDEEKEKLDLLAKALSEKKSLKLEIKGGWDPEKDRQALQKIWFENLLKAVKLKSKISFGETSLDKVEIASEERPRYIEKAWKEKISEFSAQEVSLDVEGKQAFLIQHAPITESNLRNLAIERGLRIKDYLFSLDMISEDRLFLMEPVISDGKTEKGADKAGKEDQQVRIKFSIR